MTQPADVTSDWGWARLNQRLYGLRKGSEAVYAHITESRANRQEDRTRKAEVEVSDDQRWNELDAALADHDPHIRDTDRNTPDHETEVEP